MVLPHNQVNQDMEHPHHKAMGLPHLLKVSQDMELLKQASLHLICKADMEHPHNQDMELPHHKAMGLPHHKAMELPHNQDMGLPHHKAMGLPHKCKLAMELL
jgi:hypothetical protein